MHNDESSSRAPLWVPAASRVESANLQPFMASVRSAWGAPVADYASLYQFSIAEPEKFWCSVWDFCGIVAETRGGEVVRNRDRMPGAEWFPQARLNVAENLLKRRDAGDALVFRGENGTRQRLSFAELYDAVSRMAQALEAAGIRPGDRIAGFIPNLPHAIIAALATAALGAVWSSCAPELGAPAVIDRLGQIGPKILFVADGYWYNGKPFDSLGKAAEIAAAIPSIETIVVAPYLRQASGTSAPGTVAWDDFIGGFPARDIAFTRFPFSQPLFILFSSGTTGVPKCIVHGAGGALLTALKNHSLQFDVKSDDRLLWWTTTGWVVWNLMLFGLGCGAALLLYDGSPFHPDRGALFDMMEAERASFARLTPAYLKAVRDAGLAPIRTHDLSSLRYITAGSAPLASEICRYVYDSVKSDVHLASPVGGTDTFGSLATGDPTGAIWAGEIQARALGMSVEVFDESGRSVVGRQGELVCTSSFPSLPLGFWNDPDGERYRATYFDRYPNVWRHGDWAEITPRGGVIIYGRSDATLNVKGVRIGTAELYRQVARVPEVQDSVVIARQDGDEARILLFVQLHPGLSLDDATAQNIRALIRQNASPRHVPDDIVQVPDIPRTATGKVSEAAVWDAVHGKEARNRATLVNPEALAFFPASAPSRQSA
ncbi:Acetyl-coenzyme A synthetase [Pigmentiphaga humi]|uniref:Acetyl-coenzyme A synthetase n=1 Tax=Pigmentiphaga humi TaxID=2478468 RepID=A0A3P4B6G5_9BURK|nr:acetoacetate--CoA ligase [Pigmentiphaga humi]VCU71672.1 Acetyl-coenzyme A synthetase [Pigmentiphaga humi]